MLGPRALQRVLIGRPLPTAAATEERLTRPRAIGAFGLDALSSVAYGPDEILYVLLLAGAAGAGWDIPIALAIAALLVIVTASTGRPSTPTRGAAGRSRWRARTWARPPGWSPPPR